MTRRLRARTKRRVGATLLASSLIAASALGLMSPAVAQEEPEKVDVDVTKLALYASPVTDVVPDTVTDSFPPNVVCLLFAQLCPEATDDLRKETGDLIGEIDDSAPSEPIQPIQPDGIAVAFSGGNIRYQSAVELALPDVPAGEEIVSYVVTFAQNPGQSYSRESPAFRQAVQAAILGAANRNPEQFAAEFQKALAEEPQREFKIGIEACPLTKAFEESPPPQALPDDDIPRDDSGDLAVNCLYGTNGSFDGENLTWSFDLTFAAMAWADGTLENHGIFLRPIGGANLAFGDPDTSQNAQVVLDTTLQPASAEIQTAPEPEPFTPAPPPPANSGQVGGNEPATSAPPPASSTMFPPAAAAPPADSGQVPAPETAPAPAPVPAPPLVVADQAEPGTFWAIWLLVPVFLGGMYMLAQSLTAEPAVAVASRGGAMTRLIERQQALTPTPPPVQV
jgi:hypothetical protein